MQINAGSGALEWAVLVFSSMSRTTERGLGQSEHAKALTALADGQLQHLVQLLVGVIGREAQLVKTGQKCITQSQLMS